MYYYPYVPVYRQYQYEYALAEVQGGPLAPDLKGQVYFVQLPFGVEVFVQVSGLPPFKKADNGKQIGPHGFHIHEKGSCAIGDDGDPFQAAGGHWNPNNQPHGHHPGDFPVLFSNNGYAQMAFFTDRFNVQDIIGKSVIIHQGPDDYQSQPSGNAGPRLACGIIQDANGN
ncbi:superoxide dismutase family protein [Thalassobacillus sp. CUG 92003]|uniref:superoxide dismutase family protein n=1 Tax=Thalassobacillus sp. CUG 92003 TaxID=2736641 RepID=UPI0015E7DF0E|nr:superoxide dismutase family protein [Thalassobacillus sp. CUG 92003]